MILCGISSYAVKRPDAEAIFAILITQYSSLTANTNPLVVLRLMRVTSCYLITFYF